MAGRPPITIRLYSDAIPISAGGTRSRVKNRGSPNWARRVNTTAIPADSRADCPMIFFKPARSPSPYFCAIFTEKPWVKPWASPSSIQFSQSTVPSAANASSPTPLPTMAVSTTVYSCWKILPHISGRAKENSSRKGLPWVIVMVLDIFQALLFMHKIYAHCTEVFPVCQFTTEGKICINAQSKDTCLCAKVTKRAIIFRQYFGGIPVANRKRTCYNVE